MIKLTKQELYETIEDIIRKSSLNEDADVEMAGRVQKGGLIIGQEMAKMVRKIGMEYQISDEELLKAAIAQAKSILKTSSSAE